MIQSYKDYLIYKEADRISLNQKNNFFQKIYDEVLKFQRLMRQLEYLTNCQKNSLMKLITKFRYYRLGTKLGFTIPINIFGPGLSIAHFGTIVVNNGAKVGTNCRLHVCVNIGTEAGKASSAPSIGNNCYIGPGAKLFGPIIIGDNTVIGANSVVNTSFPEGNVTIAGVPARVISNKNSDRLLIKGYTNS